GLARRARFALPRWTRRSQRGMQDEAALVLSEPSGPLLSAAHARSGAERTEGLSVASACGRGWLGRRALDVVLSLVLLVLSLPVFLLLAVLIKLTSVGPVFFRQRRVGRG